MNVRTFFIMHSSHNFQHAKDLPVRNVASYPESIYISIDFVEKYKNGLSGKYTFDSMRDSFSNDTPLYVREPSSVPGYPNLKFFLRGIPGYWWIQAGRHRLFELSTPGQSFSSNSFT